MSAPSPEARIAAAQAEATAARTRLFETVDALKQRVSPQALAHDAAETLKDKSVAIAADMTDAVRQRPAAVAAVMGGVALFFARRQVFGLLRRATGTRAESSSSRSKSRKGPAK